MGGWHAALHFEARAALSAPAAVAALFGGQQQQNMLIRLGVRDGLPLYIG